MILVEISVIIIGVLGILFSIYMIIRNELVCGFRIKFIEDESSFYEKHYSLICAKAKLSSKHVTHLMVYSDLLPSYETMYSKFWIPLKDFTKDLPSFPKAYDVEEECSVEEIDKI